MAGTKMGYMKNIDYTLLSKDRGNARYEVIISINDYNTPPPLHDEMKF